MPRLRQKKNSNLRTVYGTTAIIDATRQFDRKLDLDSMVSTHPSKAVIERATLLRTPTQRLDQHQGGTRTQGNHRESAPAASYTGLESVTTSTPRFDRRTGHRTRRCNSESTMYSNRRHLEIWLLDRSTNTIRSIQGLRTRRKRPRRHQGLKINVK